jgi:hypothetical protein
MKRAFSVEEAFYGFETGGFGADVTKVVEEVASGCDAGAMDVFFFGSNPAYNSWVCYFSSMRDLVFVDEKHGVGSGDTSCDALG